MKDKYFQRVDLEFTVDKMPDRPWLLNLIYTADKDHEIFTGERFEDPLI